MSSEIFERTARLIGEDALYKLKCSHVAVFGVGGVGSYTVEALVRAGVGAVTAVDGDVVTLSNINRQLVALHSTIGRYKAEVAAQRARDINPEIEFYPKCLFYTGESCGEFDLKSFDYIIDAIDMVTSKLVLAVCAQQAGARLVSCMGTGNKLDPSRLEFADIYQTSQCPLARVMRRELKQRGVSSLRVLYSREAPVKMQNPPGSVSFVPSVAGLMLAGEAVRTIAFGV